jgi:UDP:flavonoid glycosyltransferase YjiC (YdhE family)
VSGPVIAIFCMAETGHFKQIRPLIADLAARGLDVHVFTDGLFGPDVGRAGAKLVDIFAAHPLDLADNKSMPFPCRYVSYAGTYAEEIIAKVKALAPALILCETFSVIGRVAAQVLGIPFVNVMTGHNVDPARFMPMLKGDPRVAVSDRCHHAVEILRERYALPDASPFCYFTGLSPTLNICCQPPGFLTEAERKIFEPIAFYGCIPAPGGVAGSSAREGRFPNVSPKPLRIYACFGTIVPRYYSEVALDVLQALSACVADMPEAYALISLGGVSLSKAATGLARANVELVEYANQWAALGEADIFLTHHGMNSTHEAVIHRVAMLSYPFFWDQPGLARRCQELGIATPLVAAPRGAVSPSDIANRLRQMSQDREATRPNLERVHDWEREVIAKRPAVLQMIEDLM